MKSSLVLYLAGPEMFMMQAHEHAIMQREVCRKFGFESLHPIDNEVDLGAKDLNVAMEVYARTIDQIRLADIVVANCNSFRGIGMDDGAAYVLGYANAFGKPTYGYVDDLMPLVVRAQLQLQYPSLWYPVHGSAGSHPIDDDNYLITDHGTAINLMMQCGMLAHKGRLVKGDFEVCVKAIRSDLDAGRLLIDEPNSVHV